MFMMFTGTKPGVLLIHMATQMEMRLITVEKTFHKLRVVLNTLAYRLAKLAAFDPVFLNLPLNYLHLVEKQFQISVDNSAHRSSVNIHLL